MKQKVKCVTCGETLTAEYKFDMIVCNKCNTVNKLK